MSFLQRTGRRFAASAVMAACFAVSSAFAAMLATNDFETSFADFTTDEELATLATYDVLPSGSAAYPFADFGLKYLAVDSDTNMIWRSFGTRSANTYFDSYVQFTPMYGDFEYPDDAKFVIFLDSATSNLCVVSGTSANDRTPITNRLDSALVQPNSWGRLTVSAISGDVFSFQIYVNGTLFTAGVTDTFYSMAAGNAISEVGFSGTGALDNFAVRTTDPFGTAVATINGEGYATLQQAVAEAVAGDTILLETASNEDITLSVAGVVFDTNGKSYSGQVSAAAGLGWTEENGVYTSSANIAATWTGSVDNSWSNAGNWSSHGVPTAETSVTLPDGAVIEATGTAALPVDNLIVNGAVKLTCTGDLANNWPSIGIKGSVSGTGTLTLERFGLSSSDSDEVTVGCNICFDGKTADSFLQSGTFVLNGSVTGANKFQLLANTTFNGAVTLPDGAILSVGRSGTAATATFGEESSLSGAGTVALWSNGYDARNYAGFDSLKTKLTASSWTGVCELSGTMTYIDFSGFGHSGSTVRANGLSGYLNFSSGTTTKVATGIKALDIGSSGFTMDNQFNGGEALNYEFDAALTGAGTLTFGTKHANTGNVKSFYTINGDVSEFTGIVQFGTQTYRPVVVFKASGDVVPVPTDWGQIMVTSNKSVNVCAAWNSVGGYWIRGTANVSSTGSLVCGGGTQKIAGDGVIRYDAAPGSTPELSSTDWIGTVMLDYANVANSADFSTTVNALGTSKSTVEVGANGTIVEGYCNANITPTLKVTGSVHVNNGSSYNKRNFAKVTGSGAFEFGTRGAMVNYAIDNLVDWNGTMTVGSSNASVTNIISGSGRIIHTVGSPKAPESVGDGWTGVIELANLASAVNLAPFGGVNSSLEISSNFTGYWGRNGSSCYETIPGKLLLSGNVVLNNGWTDGWTTGDNAPATWNEDNVVKISTLKVSGSLTLAYNGSYTGNYFSYRVDTLDASGGGAITVSNRSALRVNAVDVSALPSAGVCVYPLALASGAIADGAFYGATGARNGFVSVTVNGEASDCKLVYVSGANSGLYKAVAQYGDGYYATFQDAINARGGGSGDITVLDVSAPIPFGYKVSDGKLVRSRKIIFELR